MFEASIVLMIFSGIVLIMRLSHLQRMDEIRALSANTKDRD